MDEAARKVLESRPRATTVGPAKPEIYQPPVKRHFADCVHRGAKAEERLCTTCCGGKTRINVFECKLLGGLCSIETAVGEKVCDACGSLEMAFRVAQQKTSAQLGDNKPLSLD